MFVDAEVIPVAEPTLEPPQEAALKSVIVSLAAKLPPPVREIVKLGVESFPGEALGE